MRSSQSRRLHSRVRRRRHPGYKWKSTTDALIRDPIDDPGIFLASATHATEDNPYGFLSFSLPRSRSWPRTIVGPGTHTGLARQ